MISIDMKITVLGILVFITHCFAKPETEWRISKEGQFWKLETWEHREGDREKYVIFHKQNDTSLLKIDKYSAASYKVFA